MQSNVEHVIVQHCALRNKRFEENVFQKHQVRLEKNKFFYYYTYTLQITINLINRKSRTNNLINYYFCFYLYISIPVNIEIIY